MDLQADSVQGVLFLTPGQQQDDALKLWEHLFPGDSPDGFQRANPSPSLLSTALGERTGHRVMVNAQVGRIDIILNQSPAIVDLSGSPPRIADVPAAARRMGELMKLMAGRLKVLRIALVLDLAKTVSPGVETAELLHFLPGYPFPKNVTDVSVQFNSRKTFESVPNIDMNRLCVWTTGQIGFIQSQPVQGTGMMIMSPVVNVRVDVNSAPEARPPVDSVTPIIDEILAESLEIYAEGLKRFGQ